jgi:hypothetical protein
METPTKSTFTTEQFIEALVKANTVGWPESGRHAFKTALIMLCKLAQAEQMLEMRQDTARAIGLDPNSRF